MKTAKQIFTADPDVEDFWDSEGWEISEEAERALSMKGPILKFVRECVEDFAKDPWVTFIEKADGVYLRIEPGSGEMGEWFRTGIEIDVPLRDIMPFSRERGSEERCDALTRDVAALLAAALKDE